MKKDKKKTTKQAQEKIIYCTKFGSEEPAIWILLVQTTVYECLSLKSSQLPLFQLLLLAKKAIVFNRKILFLFFFFFFFFFISI